MQFKRLIEPRRERDPRPPKDKRGLYLIGMVLILLAIGWIVYGWPYSDCSKTKRRPQKSKP
jgi:hypothetical protein